MIRNYEGLYDLLYFHETSPLSEDEERKEFGDELVSTINKLNFPDFDRLKYLYNTSMVQTISWQYADTVKGLIDIDKMKEAGIDLSKVLLFRGADKKELDPPEGDISTFWTTNISEAEQYTLCRETPVILVTTLDKLPNLDNLSPHYMPGSVNAFGKVPENIAYFEHS